MTEYTPYKCITAAEVLRLLEIIGYDIENDENNTDPEVIEAGDIAEQVLSRGVYAGDWETLEETTPA